LGAAGVVAGVVGGGGGCCAVDMARLAVVAARRAGNAAPVTAGARTPAGGRAVALARMAARSTPGAGVLECVLSMAAGGEWRGRPARGDRATGSRRPGGRRNGAARRLWWARQRRGLARRAGQRLAPMAARLAASAPAWRRPGAAAGAQSVARGRAGKPTPPTRSGMMRRAPRRTMRRWAAWTAMAATAL